MKIIAEKKLKTLKEINALRWDSKDHKLKYFDSATKDGDKAVIFIDDLQDTAREWIKYLEEFKNKEYSQEVGFDRMINKHYYHKELLEDWIKHFFNLEEESE